MDKEEKKQEIIAKSGDIMYLKGYNATGVQEIADAAGIPKGSFYNYFENKEQFAIDLMECYCTEGCDHMEKIFNMKDLAPLARISLMFDTMIEHFTRDEKFTKGSFIGNISQEMGDMSKPISIAAATAVRNFASCSPALRKRACGAPRRCVSPSPRP